MDSVPDMNSPADARIEGERILAALLDARPELAPTIVIDEGTSMIRIPDVADRFITIARMRERRRIRWVVVVPGWGAPVVHRPESIAGFVGLVTDALDAAADAG